MAILLTDFRSDLGTVLKGKDGQAVIRTLKALVKAEGKAQFNCEKCDSRNYVKVMDSKTVLEAVKWITDQTQGKPEAAKPAASSKPLGQLTDGELASASALTPSDWDAFTAWLKERG